MRKLLIREVTTEEQLSKVQEIWNFWHGHNNIKRIEINHELDCTVLHAAVGDKKSWQRFKDALDHHHFKFREVFDESNDSSNHLRSV